MKRRRFITLLGSAVAAWPLAATRRAFAQHVGKISRIGALVSASEPHPFADALRLGLQNLGYSEGRNIALDVRYTRDEAISPLNLPPSLLGVTSL